MILLIFAVLSLLVILLWLENELIRVNQALEESEHNKEHVKYEVEKYWLAYIEEQRKNRSKALLIKELQEEISALEDELEHEKGIAYNLQNELDSLQ